MCYKKFEFRTEKGIPENDAAIRSVKSMDSQLIYLGQARPGISNLGWRESSSDVSFYGVARSRAMFLSSACRLRQKSPPAARLNAHE